MEGGNGERAEASSLEASCALLEQRHVHDVYEKTAHHFRDTNYKAWPKVKQFLKSLDPGALVADIGCGTGRYMNINNNSFKLGSDHCCHLVDIARDHGHEVMVCDNLRLPYRDNSFDSVISIAVIHHLTTPERRLVAVQELARILRPGGKLMIYVWAMEQRHRKFKSQDVLVPWHMKTRHQQQREKTKLKIEMERSSTNSVSEEDEGDSSRNSHKSFHGQRLTGCHLKMYSESPPPSESTDSGFDNSPNSNRETRVKTEMSNAPSSTKEIVEHSREEIKENKGSSAICDFPNENKTSGVAVPSIGLTQKPCRRRAGIPSRLRQHLKSLFKGRVTLQEERDANPKDIAYKKLMHQIMQEQGNSFPFPHHILEHSLSDPSIEGFAVREFPQSSRMRFASMDCEPRRSDSCCESADLVCDSSRRDSSMTQGRSDTDAGDGSRTPLSQNSEYNGLNETNQTNMPCTYQNDNAISVDAGSPSTINKLSDINTANGCHGECHWTISCTCEDNDVENTETCHLCYEQAGCDDVFDASDMVLEKDSGKIGEAKYVETEEGTSQEEATRCSDSYHEDITEEDILSTAQTLAVTKESVLLSAPASPHSTSSSWADSSSGDMSGVGDNNYNDTITDVVPNTAVSAVTNTSEDSTDSYHDAIIDNDCDSHSYNVTNSHIDVDQTNGVISDDGIVSDDDSINICNVNDAVTIGGDYDRTSKVSPGTGHSLLLAKPHKMPSLARCDSLPSDDEEWARTTAQAIEAIQTQVLQGVGSCNYCTNHQAVGQKINLGALQLNGHSVHHGVSSTSSDICSSTDDDITDSYLNSVTMTSVNHAKTTVGTTGDYMQGAVDNSRDHTLDSADTSDTFKRFYHVFREGELVELIERHVDCLDVISACYDHANWCVIAEKVQVWKI